MIQQGKLAKELDFVSHHVRTKLDELKRQEVNRLRTLIKAKQDLEGGNGMLFTRINILVVSFCFCFYFKVKHYNSDINIEMKIHCISMHRAIFLTVPSLTL